MITVNGTPITDQEIAREVQYHPAGSLEAAMREASRALVVRTLLLQEAAAQGLTPAGTPGGPAGGAPAPAAAPGEPAAEEQAIAALLDREISLPVPAPSMVAASRSSKSMPCKPA